MAGEQINRNTAMIATDRTSRKIIVVPVHFGAACDSRGLLNPKLRLVMGGRRSLVPTNNRFRLPKQLSDTVLYAIWSGK